MNKLQCIRCGKKWNMTADGICFYCDQKHWETYFEKLAGKKR